MSQNLENLREDPRSFRSLTNHDQEPLEYVDTKVTGPTAVPPEHPRAPERQTFRDEHYSNDMVKGIGSIRTYCLLSRHCTWSYDSYDSYDMNYPTNLTEQGFKNLRDQRALCDCILVAQDVSFHVHKSLLASVSDYFRAMFCSGMRESNTNIIPLQGITAEGLNKIINFIYTGQVQIGMSDVEDVLGTVSTA